MVKKIILTILLAISVLNITAQEAKIHLNDLAQVGLIKNEAMPIYKGNLLKFIEGNIIYPISALSDSLEGKIFVSFYVDTLGNTFNHKIINEVRNDLDQEAIRVTRLIKFEKPAMHNGRPVEVKYTIPVEFRLTKSVKKHKMGKSTDNPGTS